MDLECVAGWVAERARAAAPASWAVATFAELGYAQAPFGVGVRTGGGGRAMVQFVLVPSARSRSCPDTAIEGEPAAVHPQVELPDSGPVAVEAVEGWLAWVISSARSPRLASVATYSQVGAPAGSAVPYGVRLVAHSQDRVVLLFRHLLEAGAAWDRRHPFVPREWV